MRALPSKSKIKLKEKIARPPKKKKKKSQMGRKNNPKKKNKTKILHENHELVN
jgi:hypothetical protein